jgi:hypothetical protein
MAVLDASALLRLYLADGPLPQGLEPVMERGCRGDLILLVPDLCWLQINSVLCRQIKRELLSSDEVSELFADIERLPLRAPAVLLADASRQSGIGVSTEFRCDPTDGELCIDCAVTPR